jgi:mono/diheme cytochrome c family protein
MAFRGFLIGAVALAGAASGGFWYLTAPEDYEAVDLPAHTPDLGNGERLFWIGGCGSCHAAPDAKGDDKLRLVGGLVLDTPFGRFHVPNISPHPSAGIGGWTEVQFVQAMRLGVSPDGRHYYPAFPYTAYARMPVEDLLDLKAYLDTLEPVASEAGRHELAFPYNIRRFVGLWKRLNLDSEWVVAIDDANPQLARGRYLVEGPGHCAECHTPRDGLGGLDPRHWLAGAPAPEGEGTVPNITPGADGIGGWSAADLVYAFESGFKPDYDTLGGSMASVQDNLSRLPAEDLDAIAAYLLALPPLPDPS